MQKIKYDHFYKYDEMVDFLEEAYITKKDYCKLKVLAETLEGRKIWLAEITDYNTGTVKNKSAYYVQANVHANEGAGTTAALHLIHSLLFCDEYKGLLQKVVFYIIPRVNPDGAEYALTTHGPIRSRFEIVERKNSLVPKDINEDGYILNMRWEDPAGPFKEDEVDPRIMVRRQPGDRGPFYRMVTEGIIQNYDGTDIVSGIRNIDFNRNYPVGWEVQDNSGAYPFSEIETRAVADFIISHPNIFAGIDLHCGTPAILRPSSKLDNEMNQEDLELILSIGKMAEKIIGFPLMNDRDYREPWRVPAVTPGDSTDWCYFKLGISMYVIELGWGFSSAGIFGKESFNVDERTRETVFMRKVLKFHDSQRSEIFMSWKEFDHPQLGQVEIGGLMMGNARFMYPPDMETIAPKVTSFMIKHAEQHPELIISNVKADTVGKNIFRIRATVANIGGFDTNVMKGGGSVETRLPIRVRIVPMGNIEVLNRMSIYELDNLGALGGSAELEWFVKAHDETQIVIEAYHPRTGEIKVQYENIYYD